MIDFEKFLKPTWKKLILFVIFLIMIYLIFSLTNLKIFPCKSRPLIETPGEFQLKTCNFCNISPYCKNTLTGVEIETTSSAKFMILIFFLIMPYLLSSWLIEKKFTSFQENNQL